MLAPHVSRFHADTDAFANQRRLQFCHGRDNREHGPAHWARAVAVGNPNGLEQADKADQEIAEGCNRLIRNSIICWNYLYLTQKITLAKTEEERKRLLDMIETHSPQSWGSFNMLGEFDFSDEKLQDTTGVLPPKKQTEIIPENWGPPNR